jgi:hypothetical protein
VPSVNVLSQSATELRLHVRRSVSLKAGKCRQKILVNSAWKYKVESNKLSLANELFILCKLALLVKVNNRNTTNHTTPHDLQASFAE